LIKTPLSQKRTELQGYDEYNCWKTQLAAKDEDTNFPFSGAAAKSD
jgi:hypothetical protein